MGARVGYTRSPNFHLDSNNRVLWFPQPHTSPIFPSYLLFIQIQWRPVADLPGTVRRLNDIVEDINLKTQMHYFSTCTRNQGFWIPCPKLGFQKMHLNVKLPFDEVNLNKHSNHDFYEFVTDFLNRENSSQNSDVQSVKFENYQIYLSTASYVNDETDSFNFITCYTTDTFWTTAELFARPYQVFVWTVLGVSLLLTGIVLLKVFGTGNARAQQLGFL